MLKLTEKRKNEKIQKGDVQVFYITGDCHRDFTKISLFCKYHETSTSDVMIMLGDAGVNYCMDSSDEQLKKELSKLPITLFFVHGNHEERPGLIDSYEEKIWQGGSAYYENAFPNLIFAKDGEIYNFNGKRVIAIGGAYSVDKYYRLSVRLPWFASEQPSDEIKAYVEAKLEERDWEVDYVLSHTCPLCYEPVDLFLSFIDQSKIDKSTEKWLSKIEKRLKYQKWYFGHFHDNRKYCDAEILYEEIKELGSEDFEQRLGRPKFKMNELVLFYYGNGTEKIELYGRIQNIDAYGTLKQHKEVSYDIFQNTEKILYKHIPESDIEVVSKE